MNKKYWIIKDNPNIKTSEYLDEFRKLLGEENVYSYYSNNKLDELCPPPKEVEYTKFEASIEPDKEHLNKSYNDFMAETDKKFMTARQGIILNLEVYKITGERLDIKGLTRTSNLDHGGYVICMYRDGDGQFYLGWRDRDSRNPDYAPRQQYPLDSLTLNPETIKIGEHTYNKDEVETALKDLKAI